MPPRLNLFTNRRRANSFGGAAKHYDSHRPRYPDQLIDDVLASGVRRLLDVGAGTGIASMQFIERGVDVLAVEPDSRMAPIAQAKGIPVEIADFEQWQPAGRQFDRVVFAASFHWVDPALALPKIREILGDGGKLALIWNRLRPRRPTRAEFESIYKDYMDIDARGADGEPGALTALLTDSGFTVTDHTYPHHVHYSTQEWVDVAFTFSNHLTLAADKATELRAKMAELIGPSGVSVGGDALAILATPDRLA